MQRLRIKKQTLPFCVDAVTEGNEAMLLYSFLRILVFLFVIYEYVVARLTPSLLWHMHSMITALRFNRLCTGLGKNLESSQGSVWLLKITYL